MSNKSSNHLDLLQIARETMLAQGFKPDIPKAVESEVNGIAEERIIANANARDLRHLLWSSIDNLTSRDLDQVEYVERQQDGSIKVMIGIADVDALVQKATATDDHAFDNTTSVYTGVMTFPMLPLELSTNKSSLLQDEDRLAIVIEYGVATDGSVATTDVFKALVRNYSKMSYEVVGKWLDKNSGVPEEVSRVANLEEQVQLQFEAAKQLQQARKTHGSLHLETIQATPVVDEIGQVVDLSIDEQNSARDLIENFMVAANVAMAGFLDRKGVVSLRRVVRTPENWPRIVEIAEELHETLPSQPDVRSLAEFLERQQKRDPQHFPDLSLAIVKLLGPGDYVVQVPGQQSDGHFGLAVHRYTHSTAPNRRYADLITQRLLKASIYGTGAQYSIDELSKIADHCNERESAARKVERKMRKVAAAMLMKDRVGEQFNAIVTGVTANGTFARIVKPPVDGMIVQGQRGLKVGQNIRVRLVSTDPARGFIDFTAT